MKLVKVMNLSQVHIHDRTPWQARGIVMSTPTVSFEFFPPKSLEGSFRLWDCVNTLAPLDPTQRREAETVLRRLMTAAED
jgi:methylenetetrahydrofolate reductase (NADPH)